MSAGALARLALLDFAQDVNQKAILVWTWRNKSLSVVYKMRSTVGLICSWNSFDPLRWKKTIILLLKVNSVG